MRGGDAVVGALVDHGVDTAFTVSGESFLYVLDAMRRDKSTIRLITARQEGGAAFAAEAYGKLTGRPAAVLVSRGPGATNAAIGIHTARQDSTPLLLCIGDVRSKSRGREAFQEIDPARMFGPVAKAVLVPKRADRIAEAVARGLEICVEGRPGPVVIALGRDLTEAELATNTIPAGARDRCLALPSDAEIANATALIDAARHPLIIAGELVSMQGQTEALARLAEHGSIPVMAAYRRMDVLANTHSSYAGHLEINRVTYQREAFSQADLVLAIGTRLDGITTEDDALLRQDQGLIHVYPDREVLDRFPAAPAIDADLGPTLSALSAKIAPGSVARLAWRDHLRAEYLDFSEPGSIDSHGAVDLAVVARGTMEMLSDNATVLTDSGSFARWIHRYFRFAERRAFAGPASGAMGYAVPGAIGAALARPEGQTLAFVGDGGFMMTGQEIATAVEHGIPITVVVADNAAHGSILAGQEQAFGSGNHWGTVLESPDFAGLARSYGASAWCVDRTEDYPEALAAALTTDGPSLIHLKTDRRDIAPFGAGKDAV